MSNEPEKHLDFMLETQADYVPASVIRTAIHIRDDKTSTLREKMLADCVIELANAFNNSIESMRHGTTVLRVYEKNMHRNVPRPPQRD